MTEQSQHIANWFKTWWFLILFGMSLVGILASMWFQLQFVIAAVNPEAIAEYRVQEAQLAQKRQIRWCIGKLMLSKDYTVKSVLECAD